MDIKSFGCSFIFGSELADDGYGGPYATPSQLTWPAHVAKHLDYGYQCYARPGSGNLQIAEKILCQASNIEPAVYIIGWTWIDRFDYNNCDTNQWKTLMPVDEDSIAKNYYKNLHSEFRDKLTSLINIKLVIDTLKQKNLPFIMTYMDNLLFDTRWNTSAAILELQDYIKPYMTTFDGKSFLDWSRANGFKETKKWHPLEEAHLAGGKYIIDLNLPALKTT